LLITVTDQFIFVSFSVLHPTCSVSDYKGDRAQLSLGACKNKKILLLGGALCVELGDDSPEVM
jgi:hypothetical protein